MSDLRSPWGVAGLGLIGASFARAAGAAFPHVELYGFDPNPAAREAALASGLFARVEAEPGAEVAGAGLVMICTPLAAVERVLALIGPHLDGDTVVSDVAGVKQPVEAWAQRHLRVAFVGGHPMAGGERGGFAAARDGVFNGAAVALCPPAGDARAPGCAAVANLWRALGAKPVVMSAPTHDAAVAHTSHLPYAAALALVTLLERAPEHAALVGRGFLDTSRVAGFAPEIMADVAFANASLPAAARELARELEQLARLAESDSEAFRAYAARARAARERLRAAGRG